MPLDPAVQVNPMAVVEIAVATGFDGAVGSAGVLADTTADIGDTLPFWSISSTA
jgi:hypothetical protein